MAAASNGVAAQDRLADHRTPFVRDEWYVAALSSELGADLFARRIMDVGVLLYRTADGRAVALRDRCPHRSFPLSRGRRDGDTVVCGYHGLAFGPDGRCVSVPSQATVPAGLATPAFALVKRPPFLWIWIGTPDRADPATIPDHHWLADEGRASFAGYIHCRTNYVRLHENVLDLTHFLYVHGEAVGGLNYIKAPFKVERQGDAVVITRRLADRPVPAAFARSIGNAGHRANRTSESWFRTPGFHIAHATIEDLDGGVGGRTKFHFQIVHCFTPETAHSTHYFYGNARDTAIGDEALTAAGEAATRAVFEEDEEALEAVERTWLDEDARDYAEFSIRGDLAGLRMRRIIARRATAAVA